MTVALQPTVPNEHVREQCVVCVCVCESNKWALSDLCPLLRHPTFAFYHDQSRVVGQRVFCAHHNTLIIISANTSAIIEIDLKLAHKTNLK
jgi:hypothetical protein